MSFTRTLPPEHQFLLLCARYEQDPEGQQAMRELLRTGFDWPVVLAQAKRHGMGALVWWRLKNLDAGLVPEVVERELAGQFRRAVGAGLLYETELFRVLDLFRGRGIPAVPYKGPVLATMLHGTVGLREFGDLDILVRKPDVRRAADALAGMGYRPVYDWNEAQVEAALRTNSELPLVNDRNLTIELQWAFLPPFFGFGLTPEEAWTRLITVDLGGRPVRTLSPEDLLLALAAHGTKHIWERLTWIADIAGIVKVSPRLDWEAVFERAARLRRRRMLHLALHLATVLLGVELPEAVARRVRQDAGVLALAARVSDRLFSPEPPPSGLKEVSRFVLRAMESPADRLRYLARLAFAPSAGDAAAAGLPPVLALAWRPFRLLGKYVLRRER